jgi:hypothetical protein
MATFLERKLEAMARDLGLRGERRFSLSLFGKRERPAARA